MGPPCKSRLGVSKYKKTMAAQDEKPKKVNLFDFTEEQLLKEHALTHYEILNLPEYASHDDVKKAYRRTSLKYHPDKTGRGDDDYVFLAVKAAYDALSDSAKRQAYDSTAMPFDDSIPPARQEYSEQEFYSTFGPVFTRNLRFDLNLRPENKKNNKNSNGKKQEGGKRSHKNLPTIGDENTPIEEVHAFYDYWTRFESWRDFSQTAADELEVEMENVESRYEKRWLSKEVEKRAKQLKRKENARVQTLVERAMEADPRLRRERKARLQAKEEAAREKEAEKIRQKVVAARREQEEAERLEQEKKVKAEEKIQREKEKKMVRKAKQQLRRMTSASFTSVSSEGEKPELLWKDSYDMTQDLDFLCTTLDFDDLTALNAEYEQHTNPEDALRLIEQRVKEVKEEANDSAVQKTEEKENSEKEKPEKATRSTSKKLPWTKDELSALAKAVKKYPPGGSSRWEQIALFVNNLCKQDNPRSKEECIEKYNSVTRNAKNGTSEKVTNGTSTVTASDKKAETKTSSSGDDAWSAEEDQMLQDGLSKFPASMEKNERWANIAEGVPGKTKKQCVQRFKAIREALKSRK